MIRGWLKRFLRRENGVAALELGLVTPIFLMLFLSVTELGHLIYYSITIEKGMRSGVTYAARNLVPLTAEVKTTAENLAKTGTLDGLGDYLVPGYANGGTVTITEETFTQVIPGPSEDVSVTVVVLAVDVPYVPLMSFMTENIFGTFSPRIGLTHEQAIIGD